MKQWGQESREASWSACAAAPLLRSSPIAKRSRCIGRRMPRRFARFEWFNGSLDQRWFVHWDPEPPLVAKRSTSNVQRPTSNFERSTLEVERWTFSRFRVRGTRAFTLLELLLVIFIIGLLAALLLPVIEKARQRTKQVACVSQLKQIGIALTVFRHDHDDLLPPHVPMADGGVKEFFFNKTEDLLPNSWEANYRIFQTLSNSLVSPKLLICPADKWHTAANTFEKLGNTNLSYWVLACLSSLLNSDI